MLERVSRVISDFGEGDAAGPVAVLEGLGGVECAPQMLAAFERAADALGANSAFTLPMPLTRVRFAGFIAASRYLATHLADANPATLSPGLARLLTYGPKRSADDLADDARAMAETSDALHAVLETHAAILLPTAPQAAFPHDQPAPANQADFTCLANVAGLPAIAIPAGWDQDGLPVSVQLIGKSGAESGLVQTGARP